MRIWRFLLPDIANQLRKGFPCSTICVNSSSQRLRCCNLASRARLTAFKSSHSAMEGIGQKRIAKRTASNPLRTLEGCRARQFDGRVRRQRGNQWGASLELMATASMAPTVSSSCSAAG
jgi:hypothetical protein